jgi:xylulokinase
MTSCVISYDLGTSGIKVTLVDEKGIVRGVDTEKYALSMPQPGWAEQNPEWYWQAACKATKRMLKKADVESCEIKGIVFSTQWKGIIPLDDKDNVLRNNILWLDGRAGEEAQIMNKALKSSMAFTVSSLHLLPSAAALKESAGADLLGDKDYWPKLMWFRKKEPELYEKTKIILEVNSFMKFKATGTKSVDITHHYTQSLDPWYQKFYSLLLSIGDVDPAKFPKMTKTTDKVGELTEKAAAELGVTPGLPVFGGCGDIPAITIGSGCPTLWDSHLYLGSSGWLGTVIPHAMPHVGIIASPFDDKKDLKLYGLQSICMTLDWAIAQFYSAELAELKDGIYGLINKEVDTVPAGSDSLLATPWLHGERQPLSQNARLVFINANSKHERKHFINAVMESVCYTFRWDMELYGAEVKRNVTKVRAVGGGACSDHWMQMMADVLGIPVEVPENPRHAGAVGAAYCALIGLGICSNFEEVNKRMKVEKSFVPRPENAGVYNKMYKEFVALYPKLKDTFDALNG